MKAVEDVVGLPNGAGDLALEAIPIGGRHGGISIKFALTGRNILWFLVGRRLVGAGGRERTRTNEPAQRDSAFVAESHVERERAGEEKHKSAGRRGHSRLR